MKLKKFHFESLFSLTTTSKATERNRKVLLKKWAGVVKTEAFSLSELNKIYRTLNCHVKINKCAKFEPKCSIHSKVIKVNTVI